MTTETGRLLRRREVEAEVGFTRSTIYRKMDKGLFPRPTVDPDDPTSVRWREADIEAWKARRQTSQRGR